MEYESIGQIVNTAGGHLIIVEHSSPSNSGTINVKRSLFKYRSHPAPSHLITEGIGIALTLSGDHVVLSAEIKLPEIGIETAGRIIKCNRQETTITYGRDQTKSTIETEMIKPCIDKGFQSVIGTLVRVVLAGQFIVSVERVDSSEEVREGRRYELGQKEPSPPKPQQKTVPSTDASEAHPLRPTPPAFPIDHTVPSLENRASQAGRIHPIPSSQAQNLAMPSKPVLEVHLARPMPLDVPNNQSISKDVSEAHPLVQQPPSIPSDQDLPSLRNRASESGATQPETLPQMRNPVWPSTNSVENYPLLPKPSGAPSDQSLPHLKDRAPQSGTGHPEPVSHHAWPAINREDDHPLLPKSSGVPSNYRTPGILTSDIGRDQLKSPQEEFKHLHEDSQQRQIAQVQPAKQSRIPAKEILTKPEFGDYFVADVRIKTFHEVFLLGLAELYLRINDGSIWDRLIQNTEDRQTETIILFISSLQELTALPGMPTHKILELPTFSKVASIFRDKTSEANFQELADVLYLCLRIDLIGRPTKCMTYLPLLPIQGGIPLVHLVQDRAAFYLLYTAQHLSVDGIDPSSLQAYSPRQIPANQYPFYYQPTPAVVVPKEAFLDLITLIARELSTYSTSTLTEIATKLRECSELFPEFNSFADKIEQYMRSPQCTHCQTQPAQLICKAQRCKACLNCLRECIKATQCLCLSPLEVEEVVTARQAYSTMCLKCGATVAGDEIAILQCGCVLCKACFQQGASHNKCAHCGEEVSVLSLQLNV